jgi:predicted enzyme related to lactoylglutathione lyase
VDTRIQTISLVVGDKAEALKFYTERVGFEKKTDVTNHGYRYVTVGPKGQDLELALWQVGSPDPAGWSKNWRPGSAPPIDLRVDDCRKMFAELKSKGVDFRQEPQENPWSVSATFSDPDGNLFQMNQFRQRDP